MLTHYFIGAKKKKKLSKKEKEIFTLIVGSKRPFCNHIKKIFLKNFCVVAIFTFWTHYKSGRESGEN